MDLIENKNPWANHNKNKIEPLKTKSTRTTLKQSGKNLVFSFCHKLLSYPISAFPQLANEASLSGITEADIVYIANNTNFNRDPEMVKSHINSFLSYYKNNVPK